METKFKVYLFSLAIACWLLSAIEAQRSSIKPRNDETSSSLSEQEPLSKLAPDQGALILVPSLVNLTGVQMETRQDLNGRRESRKFKLFDIWNKPKTSPLYLINGTVCRFVNSNPICTNLSTTGLFPQNPAGGGSGSGGYFNNMRPNLPFNNPFGGGTQPAQQQDQNFNQQNNPNQNQNNQNQNTNQQGNQRNQPQRPTG